MNRVQFFVLLGLSALIALLVIGSLILQYNVNDTQTLIARAQLALNEGNAAKTDRQAIAQRIYQDSLRTNDQALKDLMAREHIIVAPAPTTGGAETPASPASNKN